MDYSIQILHRGNDTPTFVFCNTQQNNPIVSFDIENLSKGGCGRGNFEIAKRFNQLSTPRLGDIIRVFLDETQMYIGYIFSLTSGFSTSNITKIETRGFSELLKKHLTADDLNDTLPRTTIKYLQKAIANNFPATINPDKITGRVVSETFSDISQWDITPNNTFITDSQNRLVTNGVGEAGWHTAINEFEMNDYTVSSILTLGSFTARTGIIGRYSLSTSDTENYYRAEMAANSVSGQSTLKLFKSINGIETQLGATVNTTFLLNTPYSFNLTMNKTTITALVGNSNITVSDSSLFFGSFGLKVFDDIGGQVIHRDILVDNLAFGSLSPIAISIHNDNVSYASVIDDVALAAQASVWGVDEVGDFYLKPRILSTDAASKVLVVGKDVDRLELKEDLDKVINEIHGSSSDKTIQPFTISSLSSQRRVGVLAKTLKYPSTNNSTDALVLANNSLNNSVNARLKAKVSIIKPSIMLPYGNVRIIPSMKGSINTDVISFEEIKNNLNVSSMANGTISVDTVKQYVAFTKFNSGNYTFIEEASFYYFLHDESLAKFYLYTDAGGVPGQKISSISDNVFRFNQWHQKNLATVDLGVEVKTNTNYWIVCHVSPDLNNRRTRKHFSLNFYHDNINSGVTSVWRSIDGISWQDASNVSVAMILRGTTQTEQELKLSIESVKYRAKAGMAVEQEIELGQVQNPLRDKLIDISHRIQEIGDLQLLWR